MTPHPPHANPRVERRIETLLSRCAMISRTASTMVLAALCLMGCHPDQITLRTRGATTREQLTLEEVWETPLETCCTPAPYSPAEVKATCSPAERCQAIVRVPGPGPHPTRPQTMLDIVGTAPGPADVLVQYRQPESSSWLTEHIYLDFVPTPQLPTLQLGMGRPTGPFKLEHISSELRSRDIETPARCELENDFHEIYICFGRELFGTDRRYASCAHTARCGVALHDPRFWIVLGRDPKTGRIVRIAMRAATNGAYQKPMGVWE